MDKLKQFRRGLKNVTREKVIEHGIATWKLTRREGGERLSEYDAFCKHLRSPSYDTRRRYAFVASRVLDYLIELGMLDEAKENAFANAVVDTLPLLFLLGSVVASERVARSGTSIDLRIAEAMAAMNWAPLSPNSLSNTLAPTRELFRVSRRLADESLELGILRTNPSSRLIAEMDVQTSSAVERDYFESRALRRKSLLGGVARIGASELTRPRGWGSPMRSRQVDALTLDFPIEHLPALLSAANNRRDRALWLLLAASGIRMSEALNLLLEDIDVMRQQVRVLDPYSRRPTASVMDPKPHRFKGRTVAGTYLFDPLRSQFFAAYEEYLRFEFVPITDGSPIYAFQCLESRLRGEPLRNVSDTALASAFKSAVLRAEIPKRADGKHWTLHSLRHLYGMYMRNEVPVRNVDGSIQNGLDEAGVQMLMGHADPNSTRRYARRSREAVVQRLQDGAAARPLGDSDD